MYDDRDHGALVQVMTRSGGVVSLPYDLRVPFARFLARAQVTNIKRYSISPVFREAIQSWGHLSIWWLGTGLI